MYKRRSGITLIPLGFDGWHILSRIKEGYSYHTGFHHEVKGHGLISHFLPHISWPQFQARDLNPRLRQRLAGNSMNLLAEHGLATLLFGNCLEPLRIPEGCPDEKLSEFEGTDWRENGLSQWELPLGHFMSWLLMLFLLPNKLSCAQ